MSGQALSIGVLGDLRVVVDGVEVSPGTTKQRLLLALLVANADRDVPLGRIVDCLWPESPPARAQLSVQAYVSRLRSVLDHGRGGQDRGGAGRALVRSADGYRLSTAGVTIDSARLVALVSAGAAYLEASEPYAASETCREAVELWRGPAFADGGDHSFFVAERSRLDEWRWRAWELWGAAELAVGGHEAAIPDLRRAVVEAPEREQLRVLLATALFRAGRQGEALMVVRDGIRQLVEQSGLDPGRRLKELERDLLNQAECLDAPAVGPPVLTPAPSALVGRQDEFAAATAAAVASGRGQGRCLLVSGEAGIGKTELLVALSASLRARGWSVAWGRCFDASDVPEVWPLREIVVQLARGEGVADPVGGEEGPLAPLRAGLGPLAPDEPDIAADRWAGSLFAAAHSFALFLRDLARDKPILAVVDDVHWADDATLRVLRHLVGELRAARVLLAVAHRDHDAPGLLALRGDAVRAGVAVPIALTGLRAQHVSAMLAQECDAAVSPELVAQIVSRTGGNPFFVKQLARRPHDELPTALREMVRRQVASLAGEARGIVEAVAVIGERAELGLVQAVTGLAASHVTDVVDQAVRSGLIQELSGRLRFIHDVAREAVYADLSTANRSRLHARAAYVMERRWGLTAELLPALAWHLSRGNLADDPARAFDVVALAASAAERSQRFHEAVQQWGWAHDLLRVKDAVSPQQSFAASMGLGRSQLAVGKLNAGRKALLDAAGVAERQGDWAGVADALAGNDSFSLWPWYEPEVDREWCRLLEAAAGALDPRDERRRGLVLTQLAVEIYHSKDDERCDSLSAEGCDLIRRSADMRAYAVALNRRWIAMKRFHHAELQLGIAKEMATLDRSASRFPGELEAVAAAMAASARLSLGDITGAACDLDQAARRAAQGHIPFLSVQLKWWPVTQAVLAGDTGRAEELCDEAAAFQDRVGVPEADVKAAAASMAIRFEQGRAAEVAGMMAGASHMWSGPRRHFGELMVMALLDADRRRQAASLAADLDDVPIPRDFSWAVCMCARAYNRARLGDRASCRVLYGELAPAAGRLAFLGGQDLPVFGAVGYFAGESALQIGEFPTAVQHLQGAISLNRRLGAASWSARAVAALGVALRQMGENNRASAAFRQAHALAAELGNPVLSAQVRARSSRRETSGW